MSEPTDIETRRIVGPAARPTVVVLGAGGLARRLAIGPLREHGLVVHDELELTDVPGNGSSAGTDPGAGPAVDLTAGSSDLDLTAPSVSGDRPVGDPAPSVGPPVTGPSVVGLLVNPSSEHWSEASARQVPLVVLLLERPTDEGVVDAVLRGADAVVTAHDEPEELVEAIDAVAGGGTLLTPHQARWVAEAARGRRREAAPVDALTRRELDILLSIDRGETVKQTARSLGISAKTVENLQSRLFRKLAVRNRAQAVSRAHALGLLTVASGSETATTIELTTSDGQLHARRPY